MMMYSFVAMFFTCEMGQKVNNQYGDLSDEIYMCDWYLLPNGLQQMFIMVMKITQKSVFIRGFGNMECTRDSFKGVTFRHCSKYDFAFHFQIKIRIKIYFAILDNSCWIIVFYDASSNG